MKNMKFNDFLNLMYDEQEIEFEYDGHTYNFEISYDNSLKDNPLCVNLYEIFEDKDGICVNKFIYNKDTYIEDINNLIEQPLFNGKSLQEIELQITVLFNS